MKPDLKLNFINTFRQDIRKDFTEKDFQKSNFEIFFSPNHQFRLEATTYELYESNRNWGITQVEIYIQKTNEMLMEFLVNDGCFNHAWVTSNNINYLICAEDIYGGQTIVDLIHGQISGYSPSDADEFIWTDFYLSPDGKTLATIGCHWACPYEIKVFDFSNPMNLPLKKMKEFPLLEGNEIITRWLDNERIELSLSEIKTVREDFEDGTHKYKLISIPIGERREIWICEAT